MENANSIYASIEERERLFSEYQAQDRIVWTGFKALVSQNNERINALEDSQKLCELENRFVNRKLCEAEKLIDCMRNLLQKILEDFPKNEWKDQTTYRIACEWANGKTENKD